MVLERRGFGTCATVRYSVSVGRLEEQLCDSSGSLGGAVVIGRQSWSEALNKMTWQSKDALLPEKVRAQYYVEASGIVSQPQQLGLFPKGCHHWRGNGSVTCFLCPKHLPHLPRFPAPGRLKM